MQFLIFAGILYTVVKGFEAPPESVNEAGHPRTQILVMEDHGNVWKGKRSDDGICDGTECAWMGKDNKRMEMVPMIVHM